MTAPILSKLFLFHHLLSYLCLRTPKVLPCKHHIVLHQSQSPELEQTLSHKII